MGQELRALIRLMRSLMCPPMHRTMTSDKISKTQFERRQPMSDTTTRPVVGEHVSGCVIDLAETRRAHETDSSAVALSMSVAVAQDPV